ncbi:MAG: peptidoglycan bridge formation glycyltransferase FemA/FemB family protein [Candidatus Woykebacteria bacterium]
MNLKVAEITDKQIWEKFSLEARPNTFLQSWNWGVFNESIGRKIFRLGIFDNDNLAAIALLVKHETKVGSYLYCPRGPVLKWKNSKILNPLLEAIKETARREEAIFIKMDPLLAETEENRKIFADRNFVPAVTFVQVEDAWLLDLGKSEEGLLADMRKTTRYLVRHEPEREVKVAISDKPADIKTFADLLYTTASRKNFVNHPKDYYIKQFEILSIDNQMRLFKATKDEKVLAMAVVAFYGDSAYYLHGASTENAQNAGYPLQWEIIKEAKSMGLKTYNFWGVVKDKNFHPGHPWYGFSLFKRGFGGYKYTYIRAQDLPLSPKYWIYRYSEKARRALNRIKEGYWED